MNAHYSFSQNASGAPPAIRPNYPQIWQLEEMWEEAAGRGGPFPPRTHHSELLEVFPELCLATVMRNPTNKNFIGFVVIAPGSFLLNQGGENSVRRTIRVAASIIHTEPWTMGSGRLRGELQPCSVPGMKGKLRVSEFSVPCSSEHQEPTDSFHTKLVKLQGVEWAGTAAEPFQPLLSIWRAALKASLSLGNTTPKVTLLWCGNLN